MMKPALYRSFHIVIILLLFMKLEGQKGNKKDIVWTREITDVDYYTASQYKHIARLKFGDWKFKAVYPSPKKIVEKTGVVNYKTNSTVGLLGAGNDVLLRYDSIRVEGRLPGKLPFIIHFNYLADVFEKDVSVGLTMLLKMDHTYEFGYFNYKAMDGFVVDPSGDLLPFHLMLYYSDSVVQPISYIQTGTDSIILKPVFDSKMSTSKKFRVSGSSYEGFNCYINEKLVGSAIWNQSMTGAHYKFWYDHKLDQKHQEAIASMMFIIVGIVN